MATQLFKGQSGAPVLTRTWSTFIPVTTELLKSGGGADEMRIVQGLTSTANRDQQAERIFQEGIDFTPLIQQGHINWNHLPGPGNLIGVPLDAALRETKKGFGLWMRGMLYQGKPAADEAWEHLRITDDLRTRGLPFREMGWSVEGGIAQRDSADSRDITKSVVRNMALTHEPVNADSYAEIAKSLGVTWTGSSDFALETNEHYAFSDFGSFVKSMSTGLGVSNTFDAGVLNLQNLDSGITNVSGPLGRSRKCRGRCAKESTNRRKSLRHLIDCEGVGEDEAFGLMKALIECLD